MSERCDRCGSVGSDRRTLKMACFYAMNELGLPFVEYKFYVVPEEQIETKTETKPYKSTLYKSDGTKEVTEGTYNEPHYYASGEATRGQLFELRTCKRCRSDWMTAIRDWFHAIPSGIDHDADEPEEESVGSGIFVRDNGTIKEITQEEWFRRQAEKERA